MMFRGFFKQNNQNNDQQVVGGYVDIRKKPTIFT